jgi:hypothetical protein
MSFETHDRSLKYLLAQDPASFIQFGFPAAATQVLRPIEIDQPVRHRVVDGGYLAQGAAGRQVIHIEFLRRHQSLAEAAFEVGQAQLRLHWREKVPVVTLLWDLYGSKHAELLSDRAYWLGWPAEAASSRVAYRRVNLRAMAAAELLAKGLPTLYPLVPLTQDGTEEPALRQAAAAIEARTDLREAQRADHLAVLRFLAEAEEVSVAVLQSFLTREKLMESSLYREIFQEGEAKGKAEGEAKGKAEGKAEGEAALLIRLLLMRLGRVAPEVRQAILARAQTDPEVIRMWFDEVAATATDTVEAAQRVVRKTTAA